MKTYKVLEAHQGDKAYAAGDTRIADPNTVDHLVKLRLLEETGDAPEVPPVRDEAAVLHDQVETLTKERDEARQALISADERLTQISTSLNGQIEATVKERDEAREQVETLTKELAAKPAPGGKAKAPAQA